MEKLNRGAHAVRVNSNEVLISWRILGPEYTDGATYNLYKSGTLIASNLSVSNYIDNTTLNSNYTVSAVINGTEGTQSASTNIWTNFYNTIPLSPPTGGTTPDGVDYTYAANDASVGDLDGDGDYEIVLKWSPSNAKDNAHSGHTGNTILEGLEFDGTSLWRIDLGINIRSGAHYTQFMVYDLDGDGKAEVACKTADGTKDGNNNIIGSAAADYRNSAGYVLSGPEFLTVFNGETGAALTTINYTPARGNVSDWGDNYGNRVDRFLACIAYLDGTEPSLVMCRGYYTRTVLVAYDYRNGQLTQRWNFDTGNGSHPYRGQGNHNLAVGDVDGDGKDEIMYGACAIDDDGTGLYTTGYGHGDAGHLTDIDPDSPGLEYYMPHETANGSTRPGMSIRNAGTGSILWEVPANGDIGRGLTMDADINHRGYEVWSSDGSGLHDKDGNVITTTIPKNTGGGNSYNFCVWWDGDVQREILDRTVINKWNPSNYGSDRLVSLYNIESASSNNGTKSTPTLVADVMGDWREEILMRNADSSKLVIFTTNKVTNQRMYTLMHDPVYRLSIAWQNVAYNQPPHLGFYFGGGMDTPPNPNIKMNGEKSLSANAFANNNEIDIDWKVSGIEIQQQELMRNTSLDTEGSISLANITPGTTTYKDNTVSTGTTYYYWVKITDTQGELYNSNITSTAIFPFSSIVIQENEAGFCGVDGTIDTNNEGYTGAGFANTSNTFGSGIDWSVSVPSSGTYVLKWRYANGGTSDRNGNVIVNGTNVTSAPFPSTGNWTTWELNNNSTVSVNLSQGVNKIRLVATSPDGLGNIDQLEIEGGTPSVAGCNGEMLSTPSLTEISKLFITPNPIRAGEIFKVSLPKNAKQMSIVNMQGQVIYQKALYGQAAMELNHMLPPGIYIINVKNEVGNVQAKLFVR
ncbi:T9SS type A sorting domain-containing protein [Wenyingzhuangia gilva]|nr:T9SS type A sorting domain-containing protein [Wenyingzhuangia sp. chi5]